MARLLLLLLSALVASGTGCRESGPYRVSRKIKVEAASSSGLAVSGEGPSALGLDHTLPGLEVTGSSDALVAGVRDALKTAKVGSLGNVTVSVKASPASPDDDEGTIAVDITASATFAHLPAVTHLTATVHGKLEYHAGPLEGDKLSQAIDAELADIVVDWLAKKRPAAAAPPAPPPKVERVAVGNDRLCTLHHGGTVRCARGRDQIPLPVPGVEHAVDVASGGGAACMRLEDGTVWCLGRDSWSSVDDFRAQKVCGIDSATAIGVGEHDIGCALVKGGQVMCFNPDEIPASCDGAPPPAAIDGLKGMTELAVGFVISCATDGEGPLYCWKMDGDRRPEKVPGAQGLEQLTVKFSMPCGQSEPKRVQCFRDYDDPKKADISETRFNEPVRELSPILGWLWARLDSGKVVGRRVNGGSETLELSDVIDIDSGIPGTCAVTKAGEVWCWSKTPTEKPPTKVPLWL